MNNLVEDENYLLVTKDGEIIANYPLSTLQSLKEDFTQICSSSEFSDYRSLEDFIDSICFLEFLEYFLYDLHIKFPDVILYVKNINKLTKDELLMIQTSFFRILINNAFLYLYNTNLQSVYTTVNAHFNKLLNTKYLKPKEHIVLMCLYRGFLCFLRLLIDKREMDYSMNLLVILKINIVQGVFKKNKISIMKQLFTIENIIKLKKDLLSKFRLFQRKYLSSIAKIRRIGHPTATKKESKELKNKLNKNKNINYKAYEIYCMYVLSKLNNEYCYDYLAGIHKNSNDGVIHRELNTNTVNTVKSNTKRKQHEEYVNKSIQILEAVENKINEYGDIIDVKIKNQVKRISVLFNSKQYKNSAQFSFRFGNNPDNYFGGKIIQDCKTIRAINEQIDNLIKQHKRKQHKSKVTTHKREVTTQPESKKQHPKKRQLNVFPKQPIL